MIPIGRQIAEARHRKGMTQDEVARQMNLSRQALSHWEQGRNLPDVESLRRLSVILECSFDLGGAVTGTSPVPDPPAPDVPAEPSPSSLPEAPANPPQPEVRKKRRPRAWALLAAALAAGLAVFLLLRRAAPPDASPAPTLVPSSRGADIRIDTGSTVSRANDGISAAGTRPSSGRAAEIRIESEDPIPPTEDDAFVTGVGWIFTVYLQETGGVAFDVDTISVEFYNDRGLIDSLIYDPATIWAGTCRIPAGGRRKVTGGVCLPGVNRLSFFLSGTDERGHTLSFSRDITLAQYE
ncbi:MAG: helix-turn-helix transcriptional regulator [Clostridia bacterium]|nr:helix-turn-helix transcriptional regulator [Clostridia bacterium]